MHRTGATIFPHHIPNLRRPIEKANSIQKASHAPLATAPDSFHPRPTKQRSLTPEEQKLPKTELQHKLGAA
ncbi:unnamed protein product [Sphagnum compactum]